MKKNKIVAAICVILTLLIAGSMVVGAADGVILLGDIDNDGKITVTDARSVLRMAIDLDPKQTMSVSGTKSDIELSSPLSIVKASKGATGNYFVSFKNMGKDIVSSFIKAEFYDKNGKMICDDFASVDIAPGGTNYACFCCFDENYDFVDFSSVKLKYSGYDVYDYCSDISSNVKITFAKDLTKSIGDEVAFTVKNNGKENIDILNIIIVGYDKNGNVNMVSSAYPDFADTIAPGASANGTVWCDYPDNMVRYEVIVTAATFID